MTSQLVASAARLSAMRASPPAGEAIKEAYIRLCGPMSDRYDQKPRQRGQNKWGRSIPGAPIAVTRDDLLRHLTGEATYSATYGAAGTTMLLVADDDTHGTEMAQTAVDNLAALGVDAFGVARSSLTSDGQPHHNGSKIILPLSGPAGSTAIKPALVAILAEVGYSVDEVMHRAELPFGRSMWTPEGDEYGQLILAGQAPQRITSGIHGMRLLMAANLTPTDPAHLMQWAPPAPEPVTIAPTPRPYSGGALHNCDRDVVTAVNDRHTARDVLEWMGWRRIGPVNYRCGCGAHPNGDRTPSIGLNSAGSLAYFNAPACRYHNNGRPYTAFALWQHLFHGGDYKATVQAARDLMNMPFIPVRQAADQQDRQPLQLPPVTVETHEPVTIARILEEIARRLRTMPRLLKRSEVEILRAVARLCKAAGGAATASWDALAELAGWSVATVRRAVTRLAELGFIAKHNTTTERGGWAPNVLEILPQPMLWQDETEAEMAIDHSPVWDFEQSILTPIKEKGASGKIETTTPEPDEIDLLFNSPLIEIDPEWFVEFKRKHPQPKRIARYAAAAAITRPAPRQLPTITRHLSYQEIDDLFYGGTTGDWYDELSPDERKKTGQRYRVRKGTYDPNVEPMNTRPDPDMAARQRPRPAHQPVLAPPPAVEIPDDWTTLLNLPAGHNALTIEEQMDAAAAAGDRPALIALLDTLGAWDRALANGKYADVLCKPMRRAA